MSKFKILLAATLLLVLVVLVFTVGNVSAGQSNGGGHGIISALL